MRDVARDLAALELLRVLRSRLADRMRLPWWYLTGAAIVWAVVFAGPFSSRYLPRGVPTWPIFAAAAAVACLLKWGLSRATGIKLPLRNRGGLLVAAIVVAALAVVAEMALLQAALRVTRQELRGGGGAA